MLRVVASNIVVKIVVLDPLRARARRHPLGVELLQHRVDRGVLMHVVAAAGAVRRVVRAHRHGGVQLLLRRVRRRVRLAKAVLVRIVLRRIVLRLMEVGGHERGRLRLVRHRHVSRVRRRRVPMLPRAREPRVRKWWARGANGRIAAASNAEALDALVHLSRLVVLVKAALAALKPRRRVLQTC